MIEPSIAERALASLQAWAPWIWLVQCPPGILLCTWVLRELAKTDRDAAVADRLVPFFERLVAVGLIVLLWMLLVGVLAVMHVEAAWAGLATLGLLLSLPSVVMWLVFRSLTARVNP